MKIRVPCPHCLANSLDKDIANLGTVREITSDWLEKGRPDLNFIECDYPTFERGIVIIYCSAGHKINAIPATMDYELIINHAFFAYRSGFFREAVIDAYASIESLQKSILTAVGLNLGGDKEYEDYKNSLKKSNTLKFSERRLGAFSLLYALEGEITPALKEDMINLRNICVHDGYYPSSEKSFEFLVKSYRVIKQILNKESISESLGKYRLYLINNLEGIREENQTRGFSELTISSVLSHQPELGIISPDELDGDPESNIELWKVIDDFGEKYFSGYKRSNISQ